MQLVKPEISVTTRVVMAQLIPSPLGMVKLGSNVRMAIALGVEVGLSKPPIAPCGLPEALAEGLDKIGLGALVPPDGVAGVIKRLRRASRSADETGGGGKAPIPDTPAAGVKDGFLLANMVSPE